MNNLPLQTIKVSHLNRFDPRVPLLDLDSDVVGHPVFAEVEFQGPKNGLVDVETGDPVSRQVFQQFVLELHVVLDILLDKVAPIFEP